MEHFSGTLRIRNPKTLQKWIDRGWYQDKIDNGLIFNIGCGRFRTEKCTCSKCRKSKNSPLKHVLIKSNILIK